MSRKFQENTNFTYTIARFFLFVKSGRKWISPFLLLGVSTGIYLSLKRPEIAYSSKESIECFATNSEIIYDIMKDINNMDVQTRSKELKISKKTAKNLIQLDIQHRIFTKAPDQPILRSFIDFEIKFYDKKCYRELQNGIVYYMNHHPYLVNEKRMYWEKRKIKEDLLKKMNEEIEFIYRMNKSDKEIRAYRDLSNAGLYRLKLEIQYDVLNPINPMFVLNKGLPTPLYKPVAAYVYLLACSFFGFVAGLIIFTLKTKLQDILTIMRKISNEIKL